jgi:hypothetical protein
MVREIAARTRALVMVALPGATEQVDPPSRITAYGYNRTYKGLICAIAPQKEYVNLMFSRGAELPDPSGLLAGTGKRARHVKLKSPDDVTAPALRALLDDAVRLYQGKAV